MTHAKSRLDQNGHVVALQHMTTEQLQEVAKEYDLSVEGTNPELIARIEDYEFKTGKTMQPGTQPGNDQLSTSQTSVQPTHGDRPVNDLHDNKTTQVKQDVATMSTEAQTAAEQKKAEHESNLPGRGENDRAYQERHGGGETVVPDQVENRNDATARNPAAAGPGTVDAPADKQREREAQKAKR